MKAFDLGARKKHKHSNDSAIETDDELDDSVSIDDTSSFSKGKIKLFHDKHHIIDCVTPQALMVGLAEGSGIVLLKSDKLKGNSSKT